MTSRRTFALASAVALVLLLGWLRDPAWLATTTHGLSEWTQDEVGVPGRWTGGRASFFVPSDMRVLRMPIRTTFDGPSNWAITVSIAIDGRPAERLSLGTAAWRTVEIRLPPPGSRRHRRIDVHVDRLRGGRGVFLGEVELVR